MEKTKILPLAGTEIEQFNPQSVAIQTELDTIFSIFITSVRKLVAYFVKTGVCRILHLIEL
jgi:tetrahydromethanopterin S-methyltransferase subunit C